MQQITRIEKATFDFSNAACCFRTEVDTPVLEGEPNLNGFTRFYDQFIDSVTVFIQSELYLRQAERAEELKLPNKEKFSREFGVKLNKDGVAGLSDAIKLMKEFKSSVGELPVLGDDYKAAIKDLQKDLVVYLSDLEVKKSDIKEIQKELDKVVKIALKADGRSILDDIQKQVEKLERIRKTPSRGAETNIAIWKLIAIAAMIGIAAWIIYKCFWAFRLCTKKQKQKYHLALIIAMAVYGACE